MKTKKKQKEVLPEILILGDLQDVQHLLKTVNKKKSVVIFRDMEQGLQYAEIDGKVKELPAELVSNMAKKYRYVYFDFFPSRKKAETEPKEQAEKTTPATIKKKAVAIPKPKKVPAATRKR